MKIPVKVILNRTWMKWLIKRLRRLDTLNIQETYQLLLLKKELIKKGDPYIENCKNNLNKWKEMLNAQQLNRYRYAWSAQNFWRLAGYIFIGCLLLTIFSSHKEAGWTLTSFTPMSVFTALVAATVWSIIIVAILGIYNICRIYYNQRLIQQTKIKKQHDFIQHMRDAMDTIYIKLKHSIVPRELLTIPALKQMCTIMEWEDFKGRKTQTEIIDWYLKKEEKRKMRETKIQSISR